MLRRVQSKKTNNFFNRLLYRCEVLLRFFSQHRGFWLRYLLCWIIGCLALSTDELNSYDLRFHLRGDQKVSPEIVLITIKQSDISNIVASRTKSLGLINEATDITDSFFWDQKIWSNLLTRLLRQDPKSIGVILYFGDNIGALKLSTQEKGIFQDPRIFWASSTNNLDRMAPPLFANRDQTNLGNNDLRRDEDGLVRRVFPSRTELPNLSEKITGKSFPNSAVGLPINYRGATRIFQEYSLSEIIYDELPDNTFKGKIILIGAETSSSTFYSTPLGPLNRTEIIAHITDTLIGNRWIKRLNYWWYVGSFLVLMWLAVSIIMTYPQSVGIFFILWIGTLQVALSAWVFDSFYFWTPAISPFILLAATWTIFIGYQATKIERQNFQLQQEQKSLAELEQLKNNFVSLISHDLKTPIAKIQAVVDRLMTQHQGEELSSDLRSLRSFSDELNRYIQSILKVLRVESRDFKLNMEVADINEVIVDALHHLRPLAKEKNIQIQTNLEPMFSVELDCTLIKEVIINLVENAIKYTPPFGSINIVSYEKEHNVHVGIADTGEGIKPDDMDKVWGKFTRGSDQDLKTKGSGLGLYLVKYFIELHGGKITMTSNLGSGTLVEFSLPIENSESKETLADNLKSEVKL
jgi:signal transduction histidine kinase